VPVKSFDSGDSNRDLHMLQAERGAQFPLVQVRTRLPESAQSASSLQLDLEIEFAGQKVAYKQVPFQLTAQGNSVKITGTIPATLSDFKSTYSSRSDGSDGRPVGEIQCCSSASSRNANCKSCSSRFVTAESKQPDFLGDQLV
jgi:hypothetical protein